MAATFGFRPRLLASFSWKGVAFFLAFVLAMAAWTWSGNLLVPKKIALEEHVTYLLALVQRNLFMYFPIYVLACLADALPLQGTRRRVALFAALTLGTLLAVQVRCGLQPDLKFYMGGGKLVAYCTTWPTWRTYLDFPNSVVQAFTTAGMAMVLALAWRRDRELVAHLHEARAAQVEVRRQRIESEIEAMNARVNPDELVATLGSIRERYEASVDEGETMLDRLIEDLRTAARRPAQATA